MRYTLKITSLLVALLSAAVDARQQPAAEAVFFDLGIPADLALQAVDPGVADRRVVGMRLERVFQPDGPASRLMLDLGDSRWIASYERVERDRSGFRSWVGSIEGIDHSHVVITERAGIVSGVINSLEHQYRILTATAGVYLLERIATDQPPFQDDVLTPDVSAPPSDAGLPRLAPGADSAGAIDVLMLYTPAARARFGVPQVEAIAAQVISDTNTAFARSGVSAQFRGVGVVEIPYTEDLSMSADLRALTNDLGPRLRTQFRADLVQLIEVNADPALCGIAWILTTPNATDFSAFSVADISRSGCITQYTSAHEFGHSLGSAHDPANAFGGRLYPYSLGYQDPAQGFRTVMAYPCSSAYCDVIPNFSNPNVTHISAPTGTVSQNNALSINNIVSAAANWRQTAAPEPPSPPTALQAVDLGDRVRLSWTASATGGIATGFVLHIGTTPGGSELFAGAVGAAPQVSGPVPPGHYYWRVIAVNAIGGSAASAEAQFTIVGPSAPPAPTNLQSQVAGNTVTLSWSAASATPATTGYILQVGSASGASDVFNGVIGNTTSISGAVPSGRYFWRVIAVNPIGNSLPSSEGQFTAGCTAPPGATRSLSFTRSARTVMLNWLPPFTGGPPTQYVILVGSQAGLSNLLVFATGNTATFLSAQAPPGTFYVRVRAQNACGDGAASNEQAVVVP